MNAKKKGLGKGLGTLLGDISFDQQRIHALTRQGMGYDQIQQMELDALVSGQFQPRTTFDQEALQELADSIRQQGLVQPIVARAMHTEQNKAERNLEQRYEIIAGERRWRACKLAGLSRIPVIVRSLTDEQAFAVALIENLQREDLNIMETAEALHQLHQDFDLSQQQIADLLGKARATIANILRLNGLSQPIRTYLRQGKLDMGHARALIPLSPAQQIKAAERVIAQHMNVRQTEKLAQRLCAPEQFRPESDALKAAVNTEVFEQMADRLSQHLKTRVSIKPKGDKGQVLIDYTSIDELERIVSVSVL